MNIAEREQQILRVKATSFQTELDEALEQALRVSVLETVKTVIENSKLATSSVGSAHAIPLPGAKQSRDHLLVVYSEHIGIPSVNVNRCPNIVVPIPGGAFFLTLVTYQQEPLFSNPENI